MSVSFYYAAPINGTCAHQLSLILRSKTCSCSFIFLCLGLYSMIKLFLPTNKALFSMCIYTVQVLWISFIKYVGDGEMHFSFLYPGYQECHNCVYYSKTCGMTHILPFLIYETRWSALFNTIEVVKMGFKLCTFCSFPKLSNMSRFIRLISLLDYLLIIFQCS